MKVFSNNLYHIHNNPIFQMSPTRYEQRSEYYKHKEMIEAYTLHGTPTTHQ